MDKISNIIVSIECSLLDSLKILNLSEFLILLLVDNEGKLVKTLTDGDIRRFILKKGADNIINVTAKKIMYKNPLIFEKDEIGIIVQYFLSENRMNQLLIRNFDNSILVLPINSIIKNLL